MNEIRIILKLCKI